MSEKSKNLLILGLIGLALVGVAALAVVRSPTLGLDLRGGLEVTLQAKPDTPGGTVTQAQLDQAVSIMRNRVDALGVSEPEIQKEAGNRITIALAGIKNKAQAAKIIGSTAQLVFVNLEGGLTPGVSRSVAGGSAASPKKTLYDLLDAAKNLPKKGPYQTWYAFDKKTKKKLGSDDTRAGALATVGGEAEAGPGAAHRPRNEAGSRAVPRRQLRRLDRLPRSDRGREAGPAALVHVHAAEEPERDAARQGSHRARSRTSTRRPAARSCSCPSRARARSSSRRSRSSWRTPGKALAALNPTSPASDFFQHFAIILDGKLESFPLIDFTQNPNGISGDTGAEISGISSVGEAKHIAIVLQTGSLPISFVPLDQSNVSATLGKDALRQGLIAGLVGLVLVMIYLLVVYRFLGLVADIALLIYAALFYGLIILIPITMTLPGIAGMILTIGVAADANVVIFERIKEEVRLGRTVRQAISQGYSKGFHTILDANVVTLITAAVLFIAGTGTVKGFAFTLAVGVIVSMFTAILATRAMLSLLGGFRWFHNAAFMGASGAKVRWRFDVAGRRRLWFAISGIIVVDRARLARDEGPQPRHRLQGRHSHHRRRSSVPRRQSSISSLLTKVDPKLSDAIVQGRGSSTDGGYKQFQIEDKTLSTSEVQKIQRRDHATSTASRRASSTPASSRPRSARRSCTGAIYAVIFSLLLIVAYVSARFEWKYALPMIVALIHDVVITVGVYSLTGREVTSSTFAAVLTVLGYSLYDTIIVFDRVRENTPLLRKNSFTQIVNVSVWETLTRSINTTLITVVPILCLLLLRRIDAEGLRVRARHRHHLGRLLVAVRRVAAARRAQGA